MLMRQIHITDKIIYFPHIDQKNKISVIRTTHKQLQFYYTKVPLYFPLLVVLYISWYEILSETFFEHFYTKFKSFRIYMSKFSKIF